MRFGGIFGRQKKVLDIFKTRRRGVKEDTSNFSLLGNNQVTSNGTNISPKHQNLFLSKPSLLEGMNIFDWMATIKFNIKGKKFICFAIIYKYICNYI